MDGKVLQMYCGDYLRREKVIRQGKAAQGVIAAYTLLNEALLTALNEVYVDSGCIKPDIRKVLIHDFATNTGYNYSQLRDVFSFSTYKKYKKKAKELLEKALQL